MTVIHKRKQSTGTARWWIYGHRITMERYLHRFYPIFDWEVIKYFFMANPIQAKVILDDFKRNNEEKLKEVINIFIFGKSKIVYIIGARDSGKTASAFMFSEIVQKETNRKIYCVSPTLNKKYLPEWIIVVDDIRDVPIGSFAIIDEASLQYNAREFYKRENIDMGKILAIARHKDIFLIFITQDIQLADITIRRLRDIVIWKRSNDYGLSERGTHRSQEHKFWRKVRNMMAPKDQNECLFEYPAKKRFIHFTHDLPECWNDELSKSWRDFKFQRPELLPKKDIIKEMIQDI